MCVCVCVYVRLCVRVCKYMCGCEIPAPPMLTRAPGRGRRRREKVDDGKEKLSKRKLRIRNRLTVSGAREEVGWEAKREPESGWEAKRERESGRKWDGRKERAKEREEVGWEAKREREIGRQRDNEVGKIQEIENERKYLK